MGYPYDCIDCSLLDTSDTRGSDMWCRAKRWYVNPNSRSCSNDFVKKIEVLNEFSAFKNSYMLNNSEGYAFIETYNEAETNIANHLANDNEKEQTATNMVDNYVKPALEAMKNKNFDTAIEIYKSMIKNLMEKYNIDQSILENAKVIGQNKTRKKEVEFNY